MKGSGQYTSVWDGGTELTSRCEYQVDPENQRVYVECEEAFDAEGLEVLEAERLEIEAGKTYSTPHFQFPYHLPTDEEGRVLR